MFCCPLHLTYKRNLCSFKLTRISYGKRNSCCHQLRCPLLCCTTSPQIQEGDLVVISLPFGKYRVAKVTGFDYTGRTADVVYLEEKQGSKSFENVANMQPVSARYNATKVCYEIPRSEIQRVLSARGPVATAVVRNPPSSLFQVRKPTKQQALYGAAISIGMSVLFNLLFTQIDSNQYTQSQWFVNVLLYGIQWATVLSLLVGFGLLLGVFVGKFE